jgi:hypothetical protein
MELLPKYWPGFPYVQIHQLADAFVPMAYFTYRARTPAAVRTYALRNLEIIREQTGDPAVAVHLAGGIAASASPAAVAAFAKTARDGGAAGYSLYDFATTKPAQWRALAP